MWVWVHACGGGVYVKECVVVVGVVLMCGLR